MKNREREKNVAMGKEGWRINECSAAATHHTWYLSGYLHL